MEYIFTKDMTREQYLDKEYRAARSDHFDARYNALEEKYCGKCDGCAAEGYSRGQFFGKCSTSIPEDIAQEFADLL